MHYQITLLCVLYRKFHVFSGLNNYKSICLFYFCRPTLSENRHTSHAPNMGTGRVPITGTGPIIGTLLKNRLTNQLEMRCPYYNYAFPIFVSLLDKHGSLFYSLSVLEVVIVKPNVILGGLAAPVYHTGCFICNTVKIKT